MPCQYYRSGVSTLGSEIPSSSRSSLRPYVRRTEWCEHPRSKHDWIFDNVPCGGDLEKCPLSPQEWQIT